jgi:phage terminase large subunit-like protein
MVRTLLRIAGADAPVELVHADVTKRVRALPVSMLYTQGRVAHAASFPALEDEMCAFGAPGQESRSPDRVDALVWALWRLMIYRREPRLRAI